MAASFTPSLVCFLVLCSALQPALGRRELRRSIIDDLQAPAPAPAAAPLAAPAPAPEPWFPGASTTAAGFSMESPVEDVSMESADPLTDQQFGAMMMGQAAGGDQSQQGAGDEVPRGGDLGQQPSDASAQDQPADSSAQDQPADASQGQAEQPADSSQDQQDQQDQLPADNNSSNSGSDSGSGQQDQQPSDSNNNNSNSDSSDKQDQKPSNNNDSKDSGSGQQGSTGTAEWDGQELSLQEGSLATIGDVPSVDGYKERYPVLKQDRGTCTLNPEPTRRCYDGMGADLDPTQDSDFRFLRDPDMAPRSQCGVTDLDARVKEVAGWAYAGRWGGCRIVAYTVSRFCVGQGAADGYWRAYVQLWPDNADKCKALCVKMRGQGESVSTYGRTATC